jgi:hypothetical protein
MKLVIAISAALALGAGCSHSADFVYLPTGPGASGGPAARYLVPPAAPQAEVYVTSFGYSDLDVGGGATARMVHARLAVSNSGPSAVALTGPGIAPEAAAFINTDAGGGPVYSVPPSTVNVFDLYFQAPPPYDDPRNLGLFTLAWRVDAGGVAVAERTEFQRFDDARASYAAVPPYVTVGLGFGVGWWYGPRYAYWHRPPHVARYYYVPGHTRGTAWRGPPVRTWQGRPAAPPARGWRGAPAPSRPRGGGWR